MICSLPTSFTSSHLSSLSLVHHRHCPFCFSNMPCRFPPLGLCMSCPLCLNHFPQTLSIIRSNPASSERPFLAFQLKVAPPSSLPPPVTTYLIMLFHFLHSTYYYLVSLFVISLLLKRKLHEAGTLSGLSASAFLAVRIVLGTQ